MPYKANEPRRHKIPRARYKVVKWPDYDRQGNRVKPVSSYLARPRPFMPELERSFRNKSKQDGNFVLFLRPG